MCGMCVSQKIPGTGVGRLCHWVVEIDPESPGRAVSAFDY